MQIKNDCARLHEEVCRRWDVLADEDHVQKIQNVDTKKLEKNNSCILGGTNNDCRHRFRPPHGGNGKTPGGLLKKS